MVLKGNLSGEEPQQALLVGPPPFFLVAQTVGWSKPFSCLRALSIPLPETKASSRLAMKAPSMVQALAAQLLSGLFWAHSPAMPTSEPPMAETYSTSQGTQVVPSSSASLMAHSLMEAMVLPMEPVKALISPWHLGSSVLSSVQ